jgi:hypothetical protein
VCGIIFRYNPEIFFHGVRITTKQASAAKYMSIALFWAITLLAVAIPYRRFGRTYKSHLYGSIIITMGPELCPTTARCVIAQDGAVRNHEAFHSLYLVLVSRSELGPLESQVAVLLTRVWLSDFRALFGFYFLGSKIIGICLWSHDNLSLANCISSGLTATERWIMETAALRQFEQYSTGCDCTSIVICRAKRSVKRFK